MNHIPLGRLASVDLRTIWNNESDDFTPWLAREENLALLADTIGLDLELDEREKSVGPFRADIVCKDTVTDTWVLVENQLERTDHNHLGQLLTYAAGLNAVTVVWIADRFTDEHRATLDWLNEITGDTINFFGLEVELWRIGESAVAPKFNVVSKPNDWIKTIAASRQSQTGSISSTKQLQLEYWTALKNHLDESDSLVRPRKPQPQHWADFAVGRSYFWLSAYASVQQKRIGVQLGMAGPEAKAHFHLLRQDKEIIESELESSLDWRELPNRKQSYVTLDNSDFDPSDRSQWLQQHTWLHKQLEAFYKCFAPKIKVLNAGDYVPEEEARD